ncbi:hypothetical protein DSM106972_048430 [Dulcicalothrix desertica PCC 7102]|uniref:Uncharacterized protein n=1 Tax=Dulcicalothrix desertica PCC 7102 TaxID=232991 RepID=A0A433VD38_9CYAN|nr:hypothetical protein [Dulcicalothrix desertica]RUT03929.1 hypothetical protein DSM106972_048430 [Dulcicalothrix desertica PCC 7102]TWH43663.1 hypothetical protein CAL7102_07406 [Dulcicalothrix desertica PCC 7102]
MTWEELERNGLKVLAGKYEASAGADPPGYLFVSLRGSQNNNQTEVDVIKITKLDLNERNLLCEYDILTSDISAIMAQTLILTVVLSEFYDDYFDDKAEGR